MKKLLGMLGIMSVIATSAASVVSCETKIINKIELKNVEVGTLKFIVKDLVDNEDGESEDIAATISKVNFAKDYEMTGIRSVTLTVSNGSSFDVHVDVTASFNEVEDFKVNKGGSNIYGDIAPNISAELKKDNKDFLFHDEADVRLSIRKALFGVSGFDKEKINKISITTNDVIKIDVDLLADKSTYSLDLVKLSGMLIDENHSISPGVNDDKQFIKGEFLFKESSDEARKWMGAKWATDIFEPSEIMNQFTFNGTVKDLFVGAYEGNEDTAMINNVSLSYWMQYFVELIKNKGGVLNDIDSTRLLSAISDWIKITPSNATWYDFMATNTGEAVIFGDFKITALSISLVGPSTTFIGNKNDETTMLGLQKHNIKVDKVNLDEKYVELSTDDKKELMFYFGNKNDDLDSEIANEGGTL